MRHLLRPDFLDVEWDADDLDSLAEFWLDSFERAVKIRRRRAELAFSTQVVLSGFPRRDAEDLCAAVRGRRMSVERPDPDTIRLTEGFVGFDRRPARGLGLGLLGEPFDGLMAEFRLTVAAFRHGFDGSAYSRTTLVVVGELRGGRFLVKALWTVGADGWEEAQRWAARWENEEAFYEVWQDYQVAGGVPDDLGGKLFPTVSQDRLSGRIARLASVPVRGRRWPGLLRRLAFYGVMLGVGLTAIASAALAGLWTLVLLLLMPVLPLAMLAGLFAYIELRIFFGTRAGFARGYRALYESPSRLVPMAEDEDEAAERLDNPWARKYLAELSGLGCVRAGVARHEPDQPGGVMVVFLAPDGATYVVALLTLEGEEFRAWPAMGRLMAETLFTDGGRVASTNSEGEGFRRKLSGPESRLQLLHGVSDPAEFLAEHLRAVEAFTEETGGRPAPHRRFEDYLRHQSELHRLERERYSSNPFSWGDTLHYYLGITRKAYRIGRQNPVGVTPDGGPTGG